MDSAKRQPRSDGGIVADRRLAVGDHDCLSRLFDVHAR